MIRRAFVVFLECLIYELRQISDGVRGFNAFAIRTSHDLSISPYVLLKISVPDTVEAYGLLARIFMVVLIDQVNCRHSNLVRIALVGKSEEDWYLVDVS